MILLSRLAERILAARTLAALILVALVATPAAAMSIRCVEPSRYRELMQVFDEDAGALYRYFGVERTRLLAPDACRAVILSGRIEPGDSGRLIAEIARAKGWLGTLYLALSGADAGEEARLEGLGSGLWRRVEPLGRRLLPIRSLGQALGVGFVWAWIPCGLVYSVLIWALSAGSAAQGGLLMLAFGLGTLPTLLGLGMLAGAAARFAEQGWMRRLAGGLVLGFGLHALWQLFLI